MKMQPSPQLANDLVQSVEYVWERYEIDHSDPGGGLYILVIEELADSLDFDLDEQGDIDEVADLAKDAMIIMHTRTSDRLLQFCIESAFQDAIPVEEITGAVMAVYGLNAL